MFYVYKAKGARVHYRSDWQNHWALVSKHETYEDAKAAAIALCPKGDDLYTEPGRDLPGPAWFGTNTREAWYSMIETKDIHAAA